MSALVLAGVCLLLVAPLTWLFQRQLERDGARRLREERLAAFLRTSEAAAQVARAFADFQAELRRTFTPAFERAIAQLNSVDWSVVARTTPTDTSPSDGAREDHR